jgi:peptidoglycan hydrolase CwlO-like protein
MKKYIFLLIILILVGFTSCSKSTNDNKETLVENKIISATEAKLLSNSTDYENINEVIDKINERIKDFAKNGMNSSWTYAKINENDLITIKNIFENKGFKVKTDFKVVNNDSRIEIGWE